MNAKDVVVAVDMQRVIDCKQGNWESKTVVPNDKQWKNHQKISGMYITGRPKRKTGEHGVHSSFCKLMKSLES
jgi:hypothetical protein